jgi:hypothetical protein
MDKPILSDKNIVPSDELIFKHIGKFKSHWILLFDWIQTNHPSLTGKWNFYNDGKSWLFKMINKSNTIFWLSLIPPTFRVTFYFNKNNEHLLYESPLSDDIKKHYKDNNLKNKIRPVTIIVKNKKDIEHIKMLIDIKRINKN